MKFDYDHEIKSIISEISQNFAKKITNYYPYLPSVMTELTRLE